MRRIMLVFVVVAGAIAYGSPLCLSQQSGSTSIAGGRGGSGFADPEPAAGTRVAEVRIRAGDAIDAVQMVYAPAFGPSVMANQHGRLGGRPNVFTLDSDEYIIGISGRYGDTIDSLQIQTNKRTSPLYGGSGGDRDYRIEVPGGTQAVGFIGRSGDTVDAIGLIYAPLARRLGGGIRGGYGAGTSQYPLTQLYGGRGGNPFFDQDIPAGSQIAEIHIFAGDTIDSVQMVYLLSDGRTVEGERHGGSGGRERIFRLDSDEYITGISGRCGDTVDSLQIRTNKRTSPLFGGSGGNRDFQIEVPNGNHAIGFTGRSGDRLDAVGLAYTPVPQRFGGRFGRGGGSGYGADTARYSQTQLYGGRGGNPFLDQEVPAGAQIAEIRISASNTVDSLQMVYLLPNGRTVDGERHGRSGGGRERIFRLDSDEYITGISGRYGDTVTSLRIQTNKRTSPLYGGPGGNRDFRIDVPAGSQAIGFAGRAGQALDAIGLTYTRMGIRR